eukprot:702570-Alexandrium_andersonii.AAC.1
MHHARPHAACAIPRTLTCTSAVCSCNLVHRAPRIDTRASYAGAPRLTHADGIVGIPSPHRCWAYPAADGGRGSRS